MSSHGQPHWFNTATKQTSWVDPLLFGGRSKDGEAKAVTSSPAPSVAESDAAAAASANAGAAGGTGVGMGAEGPSQESSLAYVMRAEAMTLRALCDGDVDFLWNDQHTLATLSSPRAPTGGVLLASAASGGAVAAPMAPAAAAAPTPSVMSCEADAPAGAHAEEREVEARKAKHSRTK